MQEVFSCDCLDHLNTFWDKWYWVHLQRLYSQLKLKGFVVMFFFNPLSPNGRFQKISIPYHSFHILTPLSFEISKMHYPHFPFFLSDPLELLAVFANRSNLAYVTPKYFKWLYFCTSVQLLTELLSGESSDLSPIYIDAICGLSLFLVVSFALRGFSLVTPVFPSPQKPAFVNANSTRDQVDEELQGGCATSKSLFIYFI